MWGTVLFLALQVVVWIIGLVGADEKTKQKLAEFLEVAANDKKSVALMKAGQKQLDWLKKKNWVVHPIKKNHV